MAAELRQRSRTGRVASDTSQPNSPPTAGSQVPLPPPQTCGVLDESAATLREAFAAAVGLVPAECAGAPLVAFRIAFGLLMAHHTLTYPGAYVRVPGATDVRPNYILSYDYFEWLEPPSPQVLHDFLVVFRSVLALCMAAGFFFRSATFGFWLLFCWSFLHDKSTFNNHDYLYLNFSFVLIFSDAARYCSIDAWLRRRTQTSESETEADPSASQASPDFAVSCWPLFLLRFLYWLIHVYATYWKLDWYWLSGATVGTTLREDELLQFHAMPWEDILDAMPLVAVAVAWGGLLSDLVIAMGLVWPRARPLAFAAALSFHSLNFVIFRDRIGTFPLNMLAGLLLFVPGPTRYVISRVCSDTKPSSAAPASASVRSTSARAPTTGRRSRVHTRQRPLVVGAVLLFAVFHVLFPLRYLVQCEGSMGWTRCAYRFSWTMMLHRKTSEYPIPILPFRNDLGHEQHIYWHKMFSLWLRDDQGEPFDVSRTLSLEMQGQVSELSRERGIWPLHLFLNGKQAGTVVNEPREVLGLARAIQSIWPVQAVYAEHWASFNGYPYQRMIHPRYNLLAVSESWWHDNHSYIIPRVHDFSSLYWTQIYASMRAEWKARNYTLTFFQDPAQQAMAGYIESFVFLGNRTLRILPLQYVAFRRSPALPFTNLCRTFCHFCLTLHLRNDHRGTVSISFADGFKLDAVADETPPIGLELPTDHEMQTTIHPQSRPVLWALAFQAPFS
eukprot:m.159392 g.159392  ORF g.159392 m.159392 type:complete len:727 (+) comp10261_c0_seq3:102-2282(+)